MLNFYDTEAVKAFILKILVENRELKDSLDFEQKSSSTWFTNYNEEKQKVADLEAQIATLKGGSDNVEQSV